MHGCDRLPVTGSLGTGSLRAGWLSSAKVTRRSLGLHSLGGTDRATVARSALADWILDSYFGDCQGWKGRVLVSSAVGKSAGTSVVTWPVAAH